MIMQTKLLFVEGAIQHEQIIYQANAQEWKLNNKQ